jgi:hypothetical protein
MMHRWVAIAATVAGMGAVVGCGAHVANVGPGDRGSDSGLGPDAPMPTQPDAGPTGNVGIPLRTSNVDKVDLLFMIDNSVSMGDKQSLFALAVPGLIQRLVAPNCLDASGKVVGQSSPDGTGCPTGSRPEFEPVHDLHIGIVSSSLGSRGGDVCPDAATNPVNAMLNAHNDDKGELIARAGVAGDPTVENTLSDAPAPLDFLSYFPAVPANTGKPAPPTPAVVSAVQLVSDFTSLLEGVHEHGCGFEAQNEAWYRFLVQPDPFANINMGSNVATFSGIDETIIQQRADFLRPDSLVAVIVLTDENEEADDPLTVSGQGWAFDQESFPGSPSGGGAPEGTIECQQIDPNNPLTTGPNDPKCRSCALISPAASNFATECPNNGTTGMSGFLDPANDSPNLRFFHQKERFGLFAGYPTSRYVRGLQRTTVPSVGLAFQGDTDHEHDSTGNYVGDQDSQANCVNPLFASNLPTSASADLCHLTAGPRTPDLVYYAAIAGVPHELLQTKPGDTSPGSVDASGKPLCPAGTPAAQCPQKSTLQSADWTLVTGRDPEHYDFRGADFHMIESVGPRTTNAGGWANAATCSPPATGLPPATGAGSDPINGCEFKTNNSDLQFSCIFPLITTDANNTVVAFQKDCTQPQYKDACDCSATQALDNDSQLCSPTTPTTQLYGKAYPSVREMVIAHAMSTEVINGAVSDQGVVSSLCPINVDIGMSLAQAQADPLFGYNPAIDSLVEHARASLGTRCASPPSTAHPTSTGALPCQVLVSSPAGTGGGTCANPGAACDPARGLSAPPAATLASFCEGEESAYQAAGGKAGGAGDPAAQPVCSLQQVIVDPSDTQDCSKVASTTPGWCYVQGAAATALGCANPSTLVFTANEPPSGARVNVVCSP